MFVQKSFTEAESEGQGVGEAADDGRGLGNDLARNYFNKSQNFNLL